MVVGSKVNDFYYKRKVTVLLDITIFLLLHERRNRWLKLWRLILKKVFGLEDMHVTSVMLYRSQFSCFYRIIKSHRLGVSPEIIFSVNSAPHISQVSLPDLYLAGFKDIWVRGRSECLFDFSNKQLLNDFGYAMDEKVYSIQSPSVYGIKHHVALIRANFEECNRILEDGILLASDFSSNYYHVLYEIIPRLYLILSERSIPKEVPLLIDDCIRRVSQLEEAFNLINTSGRPIVWLEENVYYLVRNLFVVSSVNRIPPQVLKWPLMKYEDFGFDVQSLVFFREFYLKESYQLLEKNNRAPLKRIFLSRKGHITRSYNEDELFEVARQFGFVKLSPEDYSFLEQVRLFNQADIIVGATGAAFSNLLFCKKGSKAICFVSNAMKSPIFTSMALVSECCLVYLTGNFLGSNQTSYAIHSDFIISPLKFQKLLLEMCD